MTTQPDTRLARDNPSNEEEEGEKPDLTRSSAVVKISEGRGRSDDECAASASDPQAPVRPAGAEEAERADDPGKRPSQGWTVIEQYEHNGFRYRLTRRPLDDEGGGLRLARREEEALAYASEGYSNKEIAEALGVSPSTVGVLLFRAAGKLQAHSRAELLSAYAKLKGRGR